MDWPCQDFTQGSTIEQPSLQPLVQTSPDLLVCIDNLDIEVSAHLSLARKHESPEENKCHRQIKISQFLKVYNLV